MTTLNTQDPIKIERALLTLFLVGLTVFLAWFGLSRGVPLIGLAIPAVAAVSWMLGRPEYLLMAAVFTQRAQMNIPGFPAGLGVYSIFQGLIIGWAILDLVLLKKNKRNSYSGAAEKWLLLFLTNLFLIISVRGFGLARGGGSMWGGASYVAVILALLVFFSAVRIRMDSRQISTLLWVMLAGAAVMALVEVAIAWRPGTFFGLTRFFTTGAEISLRSADEDEVMRMTGGNRLANVLIPLAFIFCKTTGVRTFLFLISLALVAVSGFRGATFSTGIIIFLLSMYDSKNRAKTFFFWIGLGLAGLVFLMVTAPMLPLAIQRAVSFIPFIPVDHDVLKSAGNSSTWRFDMWRDYCIPNVPKYLLVGRGLAREISGFAWLQNSWYVTGEFFYEMGRYHSGPFSLLLDFGLLGIVSFTAFFLLIIREGWTTLSRCKERHRKTIAYRFYTYLTLSISYRILSFYLIFGDVRESMPPLLLDVILMRIVRKNLLDTETLDVAVVPSVDKVKTKRAGTEPRTAFNR